MGISKRAVSALLKLFAFAAGDDCSAKTGALGETAVGAGAGGLLGGGVGLEGGNCCANDESAADGELGEMGAIYCEAGGDGDGGGGFKPAHDGGGGGGGGGGNGVLSVHLSLGSVTTAEPRCLSSSWLIKSVFESALCVRAWVGGGGGGNFLPSKVAGGDGNGRCCVSISPLPF